MLPSSMLDCGETRSVFCHGFAKFKSELLASGNIMGNGNAQMRCDIAEETQRLVIDGRVRVID